MTIKEAMENRHTVRRYTDRRIPSEQVDLLFERIRLNNKKYDLSIRLVTENTDAFSAVIKLILAKGVRNYIVLAGKDAADTDEKLGYCGADIMLYAQTLGLNTWWVGGMFSRKNVEKAAAVNQGDKIVSIITVGYGAVQGVPHKSKKASEISYYNGDAPDWFADGVRAVLLAPTALNKQAFMIKGDGRKVYMTCNNGVFSSIDLGIGKYHFESGAGKESFEWA